jgi:AcrR family transcriptional regulator
MSRPRGRPAQGSGLTHVEILSVALEILDESGGQGLSMRTLAGRLGVTPMSLYRHVGSRSELLRVLSDMVYAEVLGGTEHGQDPVTEVRGLLIRYHQTICRHPQLTLSIFTSPEDLAGVTSQITDRLTKLMSTLAENPTLWRDVLIDHAHGNGLAIAFTPEGPNRDLAMSQYWNALDLILERLVAASAK